MTESRPSLFFSVKNFIFSKHKNIAWLVLLNIFIVLCQFFTYAIITRKLGKESIGIWALVIASTTIGQISSFGFSSGLIRYIPEWLLQKEHHKLSKMVSTVNFSTLTISLPVLIILFFPAKMYAHQLLNDHQFHVFETTIIWVMLGMFINNLFSVYSSVFDGFQQFGTRCSIQLSGWILFVFFLVILIPLFGLKGVGIAYFIQSVWQYVLSMVIVHRKKYVRHPYSLSFDRQSFKLISSFGLKSQSISILVVFFDPVVKYFITKNLGLNATANYELSNKIVLQARNLLASANQVLTPKFIVAKKTGNHLQYFDNVGKSNLLMAVTIGFLICLGSPFISLFILGTFDKSLMTCIIIINVGWVANMISLVHYYACIGLDKLNNLIVVHLLYAVIAIVSFLIIEEFSHFKILYYFVPTLSLIVGSIYNSFSLKKIIPNANYWIKSTSFILFMIMTVTVIFMPFHTLWEGLILITLFCILYCIFIWLTYKQDLSKLFEAIKYNSVLKP